MQIIKEHTAAFTGHRDLNDSGDLRLFSEVKPLKERLCSAISQAVEDGYTTFLCGMAMGFDLMAGECVLDLKRLYPHISLIGIVPFGKQAAKFSQEDKDIYERVVDGCEYTVILSDAYSKLCYFDRNDYLVDHSSLIIAYYNGSKGGTAYTVKRALKQTVKINNIY